jgi:hypothetical protein
VAVRICGSELVAFTGGADGAAPSMAGLTCRVRTPEREREDLPAAMTPCARNLHGLRQNREVVDQHGKTKMSEAISGSSAMSVPPI